MNAENRIDYVEIPVTDLDKVQELGATISEPIFSFPGGRRFHFVDPVGNEYALWSATLENTVGD